MKKNRKIAFLILVPIALFFYLGNQDSAAIGIISLIVGNIIGHINDAFRNKKNKENNEDTRS